MLTRCPECGTTFRVTPEQLKMRSGRVRCGSCRRVFDALETLAEETAAPALEPAVAPRVSTEDDAVKPVLQAAEAVEQADGAEDLAAEDVGVETVTAAPDAGAPAPEEIVAASEPAAAVPAAEHLAEPAAFPAAAPNLRPRDEKPRPPRTWPWALGVCVASLVLAFQALLHFRTELAALYPDTRPLLASACEAFGCKLWRPRKPELVGIEASDLSVVDSHLALTATLRNRAPFAQEYPHLEITLTDTADRALVRRVLAPTEYLPPQTLFAAGFGARAEVAVNLAVTTLDVAAAGYRLYLFYP